MKIFIRRAAHMSAERLISANGYANGYRYGDEYGYGYGSQVCMYTDLLVSRDQVNQQVFQAFKSNIYSRVETG
jgi:hypothetical protein